MQRECGVDGGKGLAGALASNRAPFSARHDKQQKHMYAHASAPHVCKDTRGARGLGGECTCRMRRRGPMMHTGASIDSR